MPARAATAATVLLVALGLVALWVLTRPPGPASFPVAQALGLSDETLRALPLVAFAALAVMATVRFAPEAGGWLVIALVLWLLLQYEEVA